MMCAIHIYIVWPYCASEPPKAWSPFTPDINTLVLCTYCNTCSNTDCLFCIACAHHTWSPVHCPAKWSNDNGLQSADEESLWRKVRAALLPLLTPWLWMSLPLLEQWGTEWPQEVVSWCLIQNNMIRLLGLLWGLLLYFSTIQGDITVQSSVVCVWSGVLGTVWSADQCNLVKLTRISISS